MREDGLKNGVGERMRRPLGHGLGDGGCRPELRQCSGNGVAAWTRQMLSIENPWGYGTEGEEEDEGSPRFLATMVRSCCR